MSHSNCQPHQVAGFYQDSILFSQAKILGFCVDACTRVGGDATFQGIFLYPSYVWRGVYVLGKLKSPEIKALLVVNCLYHRIGSREALIGIKSGEENHAICFSYYEWEFKVHYL